MSIDPTRHTRADGPIARHSGAQIALLLPLVVAYSLARRLLMPVFFVPYRLGVPTDWAYSLDAAIKRAILPITESAEEALRVDVGQSGSSQLPSELTLMQRGQPIRLGDVAQGRPLLLVAFRGSWCSYSRRHLSELAAKYPEFQKLGVEVLAVAARDDEAWWNTHGVRVPFASDAQGRLFEQLGVKSAESLSDKVFGLIKPYESTFLFDRTRELRARDVRDVSDVRMKQKFSSAREWLRICHETIGHATS